ncbi:hypothetical protein QVD17_20396 [Tagetes erecta]|uniref:Uncharacterized protein n=1 Tax=Tagetes erecta TaxID=13708 RepID=A0AAD8KLL9_TARER|nr:hypothetical protein QVD17_20396 [Tagetes erecta]
MWGIFGFFGIFFLLLLLGRDKAIAPVQANFTLLCIRTELFDFFHMIHMFYIFCIMSVLLIFISCHGCISTFCLFGSHDSVLRASQVGTVHRIKCSPKTSMTWDFLYEI